MIQAGLFPDFKGRDTLLLWGDTEGIAKLGEYMDALSRGDAAEITVSDLSIAAQKTEKRQSELSRSHKGLMWICPHTVLVEARALIASLDEVTAGHQYIDVTGLAAQVIVSKNEYPEALRP